MYRTNYGQIAGVCQSIANYFNLDVTLIRILFVILIFTPFPIFWTYLLMWILIPLKNNDEKNSTENY